MRHSPSASYGRTFVGTVRYRTQDILIYAYRVAGSKSCFSLWARHWRMRRAISSTTQPIRNRTMRGSGRWHSGWINAGICGVCGTHGSSFASPRRTCERRQGAFRPDHGARDLDVVLVRFRNLHVDAVRVGRLCDVDQLATGRRFSTLSRTAPPLQPGSSDQTCPRFPAKDPVGQGPWRTSFTRAYWLKSSPSGPTRNGRH